MVQIDLAEVPVRQANEQIRDYAAKGEDIDIINPDARHHIGVGLTEAVTVRVHGSAGYFCAGLTDAARFLVAAFAVVFASWPLAGLGGAIGGCAAMAIG